MNPEPRIAPLGTAAERCSDVVPYVPFTDSETKRGKLRGQPAPGHAPQPQGPVCSCPNSGSLRCKTHRHPSAVITHHRSISSCGERAGEPPGSAGTFSPRHVRVCPCAGAGCPLPSCLVGVSIPSLRVLPAALSPTAGRASPVTLTPYLRCPLDSGTLLQPSPFPPSRRGSRSLQNPTRAAREAWGIARRRRRVVARPEAAEREDEDFGRAGQCRGAK